jgi:hypothetical protein
MIEPTEKDVGRLVVYKKPWMEHKDVEQGVITSFNDSFVFVRYGSDTHSKATYRKDLEWAG